MGFIATLLALIVGLIVGIIIGIGMTFYALTYNYSDEKFERTINELREHRKEKHNE